MDIASIDPKPAAGLFGGALTTVAIKPITTYTSWDPSAAAVGGIATLVGFAVAWLVPDTL
jgi:hypothetical protein